MPPRLVWQEVMRNDYRFLLGATLPRSHQAIILILGFCLIGLWSWRAGFIRPNSPPPNPPAEIYFIQISGDISCPGIRVFPAAPTVQEVWEKTGGQGLLPNGSQLLTSGSKVNVTSDCVVTVEKMSGGDLLTLGLALDLNLASAADLEAIPGIGPVLARRIVEFREEKGPFKNIEAILAVKGLGPGKFKKIQPYLTITENGIGQDNGLR